LGAVSREFADLGYNTDRIPRVIGNFAVGINVRLKKGIGLKITCPKRGGTVTVEVVAGKRVLKDGRAIADTSGAAVVALARGLIEEASV
jgi:hypothetical protein